MAQTGEIIDNPVTGERFRWHLTEADTDGRLARAEGWIHPGGGVPVEHFHPHSEERFEVLSGRMTLERGGETHVLLGGDCDKVAPGEPHKWCNAGEEELHLFIELTNPSGFEDMMEDAFEAARRGNTGPGGRMKLLPGALFAQRHAASIVVTSPPPAVQRVIVPPLAWLARRVLSARAAPARARSAT
jgi:mannose-6-phosphate isomerase-like protein (cupin superfamily)